MTRILANLGAPFDFSIKTQPDHFRVTELRAAPPSGEGEHLHLWVEKDSLSTDRAVRILGRALGRPAQAFGVCGMKDRHAVTRQWISVQGADPARLSELHSTHLRVLEWARDRAKLRRGGHAGNRFEVLLEGLDPARAQDLDAALRILAGQGLPNYFGAQRYGHGAINVALGRALCLGSNQEYLRLYLSARHLGPYEREAELQAVLGSEDKGAWRQAAHGWQQLPREAQALAKQMERRPLDVDSLLRTIPKAERRLHAHSLQSALFDLWLEERMQAPQWPAPIEGDCVGFAGQRDTTWVEDPNEPLPPGARVLGPLFGGSMSVAHGAAHELEQRVLAAAGFQASDFGRGAHGDLQGARRPMRAEVGELGATWTPEGCWLTFQLPPGSYATALLAQLSQDFSGSPLLEPRPET
ncbi:MAG TPA: tRNA pseudouridine(13) synthase TruD, partial [Planctomycetota bacterium]|nr:tRNA pseudouridine(13) synthase TruD [Planctomycetota bacterium]